VEEDGVLAVQTGRDFQLGMGSEAVAVNMGYKSTAVQAGQDKVADSQLAVVVEEVSADQDKVQKEAGIHRMVEEAEAGWEPSREESVCQR